MYNNNNILRLDIIDITKRLEMRIYDLVKYKETNTQKLIEIGRKHKILADNVRTMKKDNNNVNPYERKKELLKLHEDAKEIHNELKQLEVYKPYRSCCFM